MECQGTNEVCLAIFCEILNFDDSSGFWEIKKIVLNKRARMKKMI